MYQLYNTETFEERFRNKKFNRFGDFNKCECCGYEYKPKDVVSIKYYDRYKKILCDRCVDNKDGATVWSDKFAKEQGLPPYPKEV